MQILMATLLAMLGGFLLFFPMLPLIALFFMWLWNDIVQYCDLTHFITYWESFKLCFLMYVLRALFGAKIEFSNRVKT